MTYKSSVSGPIVYLIFASIAFSCSLVLPVPVRAVDTADTPPFGSYRLTAPDSIVRIPFDIYRGDIRMAAEVNGRPVKLLLDDGFMWDALLLWGAAVDSLHLKYDGEIAVGDTSQENVLASKTASGIVVRFPGVEFFDQTAVVTPSTSSVGAMWVGSEGQVSAAFFKNFVVEINFDQMIITLIEPKRFVPGDRGHQVPLKPLGFGPSAIPATLVPADGRVVPVDLMLDLGYNDQLQIVTTGEHRIPAPERTLPANLGTNIQGVPTVGKVGRLARLMIGGLEMTDVLVAFVSPESSDRTYSEVMVGLGLLSRFNIVYDYPHQRFYLEPNRRFSAPFEHGMSGFASRRVSDAALEITQIYPESPASEVGLRLGDRITAINGQPVSQMEPDSLYSMWRQSGRTVTLSILRDTTMREVSLTLRRII